jgi:hypothetical protein
MEIQTNYYLARDKPYNITLESHKDTTSRHSSRHDQGLGPGPNSP